MAKRGHGSMPSPGYGSPAQVRGFDKSGLKLVVVSNLGQLSGIKKDEGIIISSTLGMRKKLMLIEEALKKKLAVVNVKDLGKFTEQAKKAFEERVAQRKEKLAKQKAKKKEVKKEKKKEEKKEEKTDEEKQIEEKKEKDKILSTKG